jgi:hypothetical protein
MSKKTEIDNADFGELFRKLDPDEDEAARRFRQIRSGLERFFRARGCSDPESLADETVTRVAIKAASLVFDGRAAHFTVFYSFALNIYREFAARLRSEVQTLDSNFISPDRTHDPDSEMRFDCLDECLLALSESDRTVILDYFEREKSQRIERRKKLADRLNLSMSGLHVKIHRMKLQLRICVLECCRRGGAEMD